MQASRYLHITDKQCEENQPQDRNDNGKGYFSDISAREEILSEGAEKF